ncbi:MAG TPA: Fur family transcriptional regulator [Paludibacter sp.]|nr:Fur family transcriptional regulator [Paludibacter sp.]
MKDTNTFESVKATFTEYLVKNQHRKTPERFAILEHIAEIDGHFTAEVLYKNMQTNFRVSLASVYNNLDLLTKTGLLTRHQFGSHPAEYERTFHTNVHHHLVCSNCGKIKEFTDKNLKETIESKNFNNFLPTHFTLYIYGYCNKCKHIM